MRQQHVLAHDQPLDRITQQRNGQIEVDDSLEIAFFHAARQCDLELLQPVPVAAFGDEPLVDFGIEAPQVALQPVAYLRLIHYVAEDQQHRFEHVLRLCTQLGVPPVLLAHIIAQTLVEQLLLVAELFVNRPFRDAYMTGDIVHPHRLDALSDKHFGRQLNNGLTLHTHLLTGTAAKVDKKTKKTKIVFSFLR